MRKLCPNMDREDGLDTVLEVPIPEETFTSNYTRNNLTSWRNMKTWMRSQIEKSSATALTTLFGGRNTELQILLGVIGAPLVPLAIPTEHYSINKSIKDHPIEASMAKYIVQQYVAASGGEKLLNSIDSMYAMGKVKMAASEFCTGDVYNEYNGYTNNKKEVKIKNTNMRQGIGEVGSFVLWQKKPALWCLELVLSGCKISAGSDGKVAWRQTPWHHSHASRGPPRPLRRALQGLDPRSTANLFFNSVCIGEKTFNGEDCFVLELKAEPTTLKARSNNNVKILHHTIWGYFSQRSGLLVYLKDSNLLRIKVAGDDNIYWETTMESSIQDYQTVDGINIAHAGRTDVSLVRFGDYPDTHSRTRMEEIWSIEEVEFNIRGLSMDCFLPPSDLKREPEGYNMVVSNQRFPFRARVSSLKLSSSKVVAVNVDDSDSMSSEDEEL
ncbi:hypothetical protein GIB67_007676 [Kingdonia uniflora]|uniref:Uncharacterized protein n=1 Tax=Kingdonia uniflora TaxID=39325 RepID=A0A7J7N1J0_9MAGN|nr:hypothetical protein GIB67_007676 [Kingdonia uniflora]